TYKCNRVDHIRSRQPRVVEAQLERAAPKRPVQAGRGDVVALAVEDRDGEDAQRRIGEAHRAVAGDARMQVARELPAPDLRSLTPIDEQRLLHAIDAEGDRLLAECGLATDAVRVLTPGCVAGETERA